ncbi:hypothetical protein LZ198_30330 [Myxococcus sp. K15C18031901]|uniref:hypothetical protein n=1 Tax=Myxococcus dinghuensis TaxID=2906761 RepID=UPI0020A7BC85|nr:hypothetical protein [Myxococcus dinghuensis]MCP3103186.1 hypothetical protein [Myxococcus dinghuensis]
MAGPLTTLLLSGLLAAAPGGFTFEGRQASARTEQPDGFFIQGPLPFTDLAESGTGSATLSVDDRVSAPEATYGDQATFSATFRLGVTEYRVELSQAGFPPLQRYEPAPSLPLPAPPPHTVGGGVLLSVPLYGDSGLGWAAMTRSHAAIAVWGVGRVWRNGTLLTDAAFIHVAALDAGAFADDDTHRLLRQARFEDTELVVLAYNLPARLEPRGFIQFVFEDVGIDLDGRSLPWVAVVENTGNITVDPRWLTPVPPTVYYGVAPVLTPPLPVEAATGGSGPGVLATPPTVLGMPTTSDTVAVAGGERVFVGGPAGSVVTEGGATIATGASVLSTPVEPVVTSGAFPTTPDAPNPPVNISGFVPGTPAPGSLAAAEGFLTPGTAPPGTSPTLGAVRTVTDVQSNVVTAGSFAVVPLPAGNFDAFLGTAQVSPGIIATAQPLNTDPGVPPAALLGSPAPLNAAPASPLFGTPTPLNATPAVTLPATPVPGNVSPGASPAATPAAPSVGVTAPGAIPPTN